MSLEENLKTIKNAKLDIELLRRKNETECAERNAEITKLQNKIILTESKLEEELKTSGEKKLECKLGWCSYRVMPDKWGYDDKKIIEVVINKYPQMKPDLLKTTITIKKEVIKKLAYNGGLPVDVLESITHEPQDPKFNYKLNGGI